MTIEELELKIESNAQSAVSGLNSLTGALTSLKGATSNNAGLNKVVKSLEALNAVSGFSKEIQKLADTMKPLAAEMEKISVGFLSMPKNIQTFIKGMGNSGQAATAAARGYTSAASALTALDKKLSIAGAIAVVHGFRRVLGFMSGFVANANKYVEDVNLFTVSMGEFADEAAKYAQKAQDLIGIDAGQFMRNQGYFQNMATGFGIAGDQALILSKNLTMLGYDLASFFNVDIETAMEKLTSGLAGQSRPLREWGFAIEEASLSELALRYNIEGSVRTMSQAEKATLRYIAIMEQSTNAQHDMARTLETPANQMRIFNQQITLLSRSLGNLLLPIISKILPYITAFVKALRMAAEALAALFGVTLPTIDYDAFSGMTAGVGAAEDMEDALGGAAASAKKMKDYVMGFDELNIIKPDEPTGGGGSGSAGGAGFGNLDLPEYDFLKGLSDRVDKLIPKMQKLLKIIGAIAASLIALKIVKGIMNIVDWFSRLTAAGWTALTVIGAIVAALASFAGGFALGSELVKLATGEIQGFTVKMGLGIAAITAGTVALGLMFGPIGVLVGLLAGLTGVIAGVAKAQSELRSQVIAASFFDGQGVPIQALANDFSNLMNTVIQAKQPIIDGWASIQAGKDAVLATSQSFESLNYQVGAGVLTLEEAVPEFVGLLETLKNQTKAILIEIHDNIMMALSGSFGEALETAGHDTQEYAQQISGFSADVIARLDEIGVELESYKTILASGGQLTETQTTRMMDLYRELQGITGNSASAVDDFGSAIQRAMADIDWSSPEAMSAALEQMGGAYTEAEAAVYAETEALRGYFEEQQRIAQSMGDTDQAALMQTFIDALPAYQDQQLAAINETLRKYMGVMQTDLAGEMQRVWNDALAAFDAMSWAEQKLNGSAEQYAASMLRTFQSDIINPFVSGVEADFGAAVADSLWADNLVDEFIRSIGMSMAYAEGDVTESTITMFGTALDRVGAQMPGMTEALGDDFVDGFITGIENGDAYTAAGELADSGLRGIQDWQESGSPAYQTELLGIDFVDGYVKGIDENVALAIEPAERMAADSLTAMANAIDANANGPIDAFRNMLNQLIGLVESFANTVVDGINSAMSNVVSSFNSVNYSGTTASFSYGGGVNIPRLATGGIVSSGQIFVAREASPELVGGFGGRTGVMNNDQIVSAVANGVASAVASVLGAGTISGQPIIIQLDGRTIYESNVQQEQTYGYNGFQRTAVNMG